MNRKLMGSIAIFGLAVVLAGCSGLASSQTVDDTPVPTEQVVIEPGGDDTSDGEVEAVAAENVIEEEGVGVETANDAEEKVEPVAEIESQGEEGDEPSPIVSQLELPPPDHELSDGEYRWSQLLGRDSIFPVYDPEFAPAETAPYDDNELVIGVEINGEAKAYAIGPLNSREMVNDTVGGVPVLVTW